MQTTLQQLVVGDRARVIGYQQMDRDYRQQLMSMGLTRGVEFEILRVAPLGDPIAICVRGFCLSIRKREARELVVEKCV